MSGRFQDKVVIVTGSSNGIGRAAAQLFAEQGAKVTITGRNAEALEETRRLLVSVGSSDDRIVQVVGDLTNENVQTSLVEKTIEKFGKIDVLVNNAGGLAPDNTTTQAFDQGMEVFDYIFNLNVKSCITLSKLTFPHLKKTEGNIIFISSICGLPISWNTSPYYAASKSALDQIMRAMAISYIADGVRVNSINPGVIETKFLNKQIPSDDIVSGVYASFATDPIKVPVGRTGVPKDIAQAIAFLADSNTSGFIVGHNLIVDGGSSISNVMNATNPLTPEKK